MAKKKRSNKGSLILWISKKLPSSFLQEDTVKQIASELMKNYSGVYALYHGEKLYYVGLTTDLHGRLKWHLKDRHASKWDKFQIFIIKKVKYLKDLETLVVHIAEPKGNRQRGTIPLRNIVDSNIRHYLREKEKSLAMYQKIFK